MKIWNMTEGIEVDTITLEPIMRSVLKTIDEFEFFYNAQRLASHYDAVEEKWYFYERTKDGIYQVTDI